MRDKSMTVTPESGPEACWVMAGVLTSGPPRIQPHVRCGGTDHDCAAEQGQRAGPLAVDQPHPDRAEHQLEQAEQRGAARRDALEGGHVEQKPAGDLARTER